MLTDRTFLTTGDVAEEATRRGRPVSRRYIAMLCTSGAIPAVKVGQGRRASWLIRVGMAENWLTEWLQGA